MKDRSTIFLLQNTINMSKLEAIDQATSLIIILRFMYKLNFQSVIERNLQTKDIHALYSAVLEHTDVHNCLRMAANRIKVPK